MAVASLFEDLLDQYKIEQHISEKRYTNLYQAYDVDDDRQVRLEILRPECAQRRKRSSLLSRLAIARRSRISKSLLRLAGIRAVSRVICRQPSDLAMWWTLEAADSGNTVLANHCRETVRCFRSQPLCRCRTSGIEGLTFLAGGRILAPMEMDAYIWLPLRENRSNPQTWFRSPNALTSPAS